MIMRMNKGSKFFIVAAGFFVISWVSLRTYHYFFDTSSPLIVLHGLEDQGHYAGNIQCILSGNDGYKVSDISVWLDSAPLINRFKINRREFDHPFNISSQALSNGKHTLRIEAVNGTYRRNKIVQERSFIVDNVPLQAAFVKPDSDLKVFQGRTLHLQFQVNKEIKTATVRTLANTFNSFPESPQSSIYEAYIPISCEESPNEYLFTLEIQDHVGNKQLLENKFQVIGYPFKRQTLTFNQDPKLDTQYADFKEEQLPELTTKSPTEKLWRGSFCMPLEMTGVTCDFGTVRTTKEHGRYAHKAVDLAGRPKSVVWSAQDGIVIVKDRFNRSGNTIIVDHGRGVLTLYCHLDSFANINVGDKVRKGNPLGKMGKTGYATNDHLHWAMYVNNVPVDPMQWTKNNF